MKIHLTKHTMTRTCQPEQLEQFQQAGWQPVDQQQVGEVIRLKPAVKSKATVTALTAASIITQQGDE